MHRLRGCNRRSHVDLVVSRLTGSSSRSQSDVGSGISRCTICVPLLCWGERAGVAQENVVRIGLLSILLLQMEVPYFSSGIARPHLLSSRTS